MSRSDEPLPPTGEAFGSRRPENPSPQLGSLGARWLPPEPEDLREAIPGYEIHSLIGHGGMGAVYLGSQRSLSRKVAIKILPPNVERESPGYIERFRNEARLMASVSHPCIITVYDFGQTEDGLLYFVMEFIEGMDILQMIRASPGRRLAPSSARDIAIHVCDALGCAHAKGVIHRDIKPANVLIDHDGHVKVADFGLAKWSSPELSAHLTLSGAAVGTPGYIAPEALLEGARVDHRADLYAVGAMLFQMLTGRPPQGWLQDPSSDVPGLSPEFDRILRRALESNPDLRHQSASELRVELAAIREPSSRTEIDTNAETVWVARAASSAGEIRSQMSLLPWVAGFVVAVAAAVAIWWFGGRNEAAPATQETQIETITIPEPLAAPNRRVEGETLGTPPLSPPPRRVED